MIDHDGGPIVKVVQQGKILNHFCVIAGVLAIYIF